MIRPVSCAARARNRARHGAQRVAQFREGRRFEPAGDALLQVALNQDLRFDGQLAVVIRGQLVANLLTRQHVHHARTSLNWRRSVWRARVSRDFTVPTATSSESAISS